MTEQEAINYIEDKYKYCGNDCNGLYVEECKEAKDMAISALERQIAVPRTIVEGEYFCPRCKYVMRHPGYCRNCGQHTY